VAFALAVAGCAALLGSTGLAAAGVPRGRPPARGDFDGNGFGDLAAGVPFEDLGLRPSAGAVNVLYGTRDGIRPAGNQVWHQGSRGIPGEFENGDRFGYALVSGDFDGDRRDDLAIGAPFEVANGKSGAGIVHVLYGTRDGLRAGGNQLFHQDLRGLRDGIEIGDRFGEALAAGDFNADGRTDLAIGVPGEDVRGHQGAGGVHTVYGSRRGLRSRGSEFLSQARRGVAGAPRGFDLFGATLAAGSIGRGGARDLAVASTGDEPGGAVYAFYGGASGIDTRESQQWHRGRQGVPGEADGEEVFGAGLAFGGFGNGSVGDLAIGALGADVGGVAGAGEVLILYGRPDGLSAQGSQTWNQGSQGIAEDPEGGDGFGTALAAANFGGGSRDDLAVGVPGESVGGVTGAGAVNVLFGSTGGLDAEGNELWHQDRDGVPEEAEGGDGFGIDLVARDVGRSRQADLSVQAISESVDTTVNAGAVNVLYGAVGGLRSRGSQLWHQDRNRILQGAEPGDRFGTLTRLLA
jgi:hypothetical protein